MLNYTTAITEHKRSNTTRVFPNVYARFNLNRYPEFVTAADHGRIDTGRIDPDDYGTHQFALTSNVVKPFRYAHGVTYPMISISTKDEAIANALAIQSYADNAFDRVKMFLPSPDNVYNLYCSPLRSGTRSKVGVQGYYSSEGENVPIGDIMIQYCYPDLEDNDPYFILQENEIAEEPRGLYDDPAADPSGINVKNMFMHGNAIDFKFNTVITQPKHFEVIVGWRPNTSTSSSLTETVVFSSKDNYMPRMSTGTVYYVTGGRAVSGGTELSLLGSSISDNGKKLEGVAIDYVDMVPGEYIAIRKSDNRINGVYKVVSIDDLNGKVTIEGPEVTFTTSDMNQVMMTQAYSIAPGEFTLYMTDTAMTPYSWTTKPKYWTPGSDQFIDINYVRLKVWTLDKVKQYLEVIEIAPSLYADLTDVVKSLDVTMDAASNEAAYPVGVATSNTGSISFDNTSGVFNFNNHWRRENGVWVGSPVAGMLYDGVEFIIEAEESSTSGHNLLSTVRIATMISDTWTAEDDLATVQLTDYARVFMEREAPDLLLRSEWLQHERANKSRKNKYKNTFSALSGYTVSGVVQTLMAAAGWTRVLPWPDRAFSNAHGIPLTEDEPTVKYFWSRKEQSVWEVLQDLASSTQTAIFFDRFGLLRILPRNMISEYNRGVSWSLQGTKQGNLWPEILSLSKEKSVPVNRVNVTYNSITSINERMAANAIFWEPDENMALRLAEITSPIEKGAKRIKIKTKNGSAFNPSGHVVFSNNPVPYKASAYYLTYNLPRGPKSKSNWKKYWVKSMDGVKQLEELNDGYPVVPANDLYIENGLSGTEKTSTIKFPVESSIDVEDANDGWKIRYIIDGLDGDSGNIDGSRWRTYDRDGECWIMSCRKEDFPKGDIKVPNNSKVNAGDQYLVAFRDFSENEENESLDRIIAKFKFVEGVGSGDMAKGDAAAGFTFFNRMGGDKERFYTVSVYLGDSNPGKGSSPTVTMTRVTDDGLAEKTDNEKGKRNIEADFKKHDGTSIDLKEWCILELEIMKQRKGDDDEYDYVFNVYLNGFYVAKFIDDSKFTLAPNTRAGFFVKNGIVHLDAFVVVDEPRKSKPKKQEKARKKLRKKMRKTQRKKRKDKKKNSKGNGNNGRGGSAARPKGANKSRRGGRSGRRKRK